MKRSIHLEGLRLEASIGILEHELKAKQPLLISISVDLDEAELVPSHDAVTDVLDYRHLRHEALAQAQAGHINMLETLAGRIAVGLLAHAAISRVRVRVDKPSIFSDCHSVAVEVFANQADQKKYHDSYAKH